MALTPEVVAVVANMAEAALGAGNAARKPGKQPGAPGSTLCHRFPFHCGSSRWR
ncbi:MAG: hypothetical protein ACREJP_07685 [Candidatus Methylomirabilales bacterium]